MAGKFSPVPDVEHRDARVAPEDAKLTEPQRSSRSRPLQQIWIELKSLPVK